MDVVERSEGKGVGGGEERGKEEEQSVVCSFVILHCYPWIWTDKERVQSGSRGWTARHIYSFL